MERLTSTLSQAAAVTRFVQRRVAALIRPKSTDEDRHREELILNTILLTSIALLIVLDGTILYNIPKFGSAYQGVSLIPFTIILAIFASLFVLSRRGKVRLASYLLIGFYITGTIYCGFVWGASLPATLLTTTLVIITSSILIGTRCGMIVSVSMVCILSYLGFHEYQVLGVQAWKYTTISTTDIITYSGIFFFITLLSWLSNREIENSLKRARRSEAELKLERDNLEITVEERTESLRKMQLDQMIYLSRSAEFGELSRGLFHDLMTPLVSISLGIDALGKTDAPEVKVIRESLCKTIEASNKMGEFMSTVRKTMRSSAHVPDSEKSCDMKTSLEHILQILAYKLRNADVAVAQTYAGFDDETIISKDRVLIERILLNLISNAIDAYAELSEIEEKTIEIRIRKSGGNIELSVSDHGCGISKRHMQQIFDPFFTTKTNERGSGLGLTIVKTIVEKDLGGKIEIESEAGKGTDILITFPH